MAKRTSINARAKKAEREVQQYLWPGSRFAGNAKRPALEDQDLCGVDAECGLWWGEVKSYNRETIHQCGGPWAVLEAAWHQCDAAIKRAIEAGTIPANPHVVPFAVLRVTRTSLESVQNLVMVDALDEAMCASGTHLCVVPLSEFKAACIDRVEEVA